MPHRMQISLSDPMRFESPPFLAMCLFCLLIRPCLQGNARLLWEPHRLGDAWWFAKLIATMASLLQECLPFCRSPALGAMGSGLRAPSRRGRRSYREMPAFCGSPAPGAMLGGLQSFSRRGRSSFRNACLFVGAPPSGRWVVVCGLHRGEGTAPTGKCLPFVGTIPPSQCSVVCKAFATRASLLQRNACFLWEPCPQGDGWWSARLHRGEGAAPTKKRSCKRLRDGTIVPHVFK